MKRLKLHFCALAIIAPCALTLFGSTLLLNLCGVAYSAALYRLSGTAAGRRFIRRYYHEILRLESMM